MLILQGITYAHPNKDLLFSDINLTVNRQEKIALIGNNGTGKSTLLGIMSGTLQLLNGTVISGSQPFYVPQVFGQYNDYTIARVLQIDKKLNALRQILAGDVSENNLEQLNDDWTIEERCKEAFDYWRLGEPDLMQKLGSLSGGQKTKVFLAGIMINDPEIVLLDEPSNHLDSIGRDLLYNYIQTTSKTLVVVSHDKTLLKLLDPVCELNGKGIIVYGGNYDFYEEQKRIEANAFNEDLKNAEKTLRKAKEKERETLERQQKLDARGKKKQEKAGLPTISMNTFRNNAERSTSRIKDTHAEKTGKALHELNRLRNEIPDADRMKIGFDGSALHKGKILVTAADVNFKYADEYIWKEDLNFEIISGERIVIKGRNGSGKTSLIRLVLGHFLPTKGNINRVDFNAVYIDQEYSLIDNNVSVYEQAQKFNTGSLQEHEIKTRLTRFLFTREYWDRPCSVLSGGEKMRLMLCCLTISTHAPDMIILDEPTNNLDILNTDILTAAVKDYKGTLLVVSHDNYFLEQLDVSKLIGLDQS